MRSKAAGPMGGGETDITGGLPAVPNTGTGASRRSFRSTKRSAVTACVLGHTQKAYECPSCGEAATGEKASLEHWRWYRGRTSSKTVKTKIDEYLTTKSVPVRAADLSPSRRAERSDA